MALLQPFGEAYATFLTELKDRIRSARQRAITSVNQELVLLSLPGHCQDIGSAGGRHDS
jgi:hypothetical protein